MSKDIDFEFGRSIGATHYFNGFQFAFVKKISDDNYQYYDEIRRKWFGVINGKAAYELGNLSEIPPSDTWTIHNNDKPLCELSDEQAAQLFNAWRNGGELLVIVGITWAAASSLIPDCIHRIRPKSERDEFVNDCKKLFVLEEEIFMAMFDAIQRGDIKAPEVSK